MKRLVCDLGRRELSEEFGLVLPFARRTRAALAAVLIVATAYGLLAGEDVLQRAPRYDERAVLTGVDSLARPEAQASPARVGAGFFAVGGLLNALLLNAVVGVVFGVVWGGSWRPRRSRLAEDAARMARTLAALTPVRIVLIATLSGLAVAALFSSWPALQPGSRNRSPPPPRPMVRAPDPRAEDDALEARPRPAEAQPTPPLLLPPVEPPVVPLVETVEDPDAFLRGLEGRPIVLLFWKVDAGATWLPDVEKLRRRFGPSGLEVIGVPLLAHQPRLRDVLATSRIGWRQLSATRGWHGRIPSAWPQVVVLDERGEIAHAGRPGVEVEEALTRLVGSPPEAGPEVLGAVEGRLVYAGRPLHEATRQAARFWFRDEWSRKEAAVRTELDRAASTFRWVAPIGTYLVDASAGPRLDFAPHESFSGTATFGVTPGEPRRLEVALQEILHLLQPVDNATTLPASGEWLVHASPVRFAWEGLAEALLYRYSITPVDGRSLPEVSGETPRTQIQAALAPGSYRFALSAHGPSGLVGRLKVYGSNYRAWSYAFVVE